MNDIPDDLIEIHDSDIDVKQIMDEIRARVEQRRREMGYDTRQFPQFGLAMCPDEPDDIPYDVNLYHHLRLVNNNFSRFETNMVLAPSSVTNVPIVGKLWSLFREQSHRLVLFYVNRVVSHQTDVNRHLISVLNLLTEQVEKQQREIQVLQRKLNKQDTD